MGSARDPDGLELAFTIVGMRNQNPLRAPGAPARPPRKVLPVAKAEFVDGPAPEVVDALLPHEPGEVVLASLLRWKHALPECGPPGMAQVPAAGGVAQEDIGPPLPGARW